jgi:hypothetical protein
MTPVASSFAIALACLPVQPGPGAPQEAAPRTFESLPVELERLPSSQRSALVAAHPLAPLLELDGRPFSVEFDAELLRLASESGEPPDRSLRRAGNVRLRWSRDGERRERELRFEPRSGGDWVYGAPRAHLFDLDGEAVCVVDADVDGQVDLLHDAWSAGPGAPLLPLGEVLILGAREFRVRHLAPDGTRLEGTFTALEGNEVQRAALGRLNHLRCADGLGAVKLEVLLSQGCSAHAEYLLAQGWRGEGDPRDQDPRAAGASREGLAAARQAEILPVSPEQAIEDLWADPRGRRLLADPDLAFVGLSWLAEPVAVLDLRSRSTRRSLGSRAWRSPLASPADGSSGQPTQHSGLLGIGSSEGSAALGPPLLVWLREPGADLEAYSAELFELEGSRRRRLPVVLLPAPEAPDPVRGVLPEKPLAAGTRYLVVHSLTVGGEPRSIEVRFTTR